LEVKERFRKSASTVRLKVISQGGREMRKGPALRYF